MNKIAAICRYYPNGKGREPAYCKFVRSGCRETMHNISCREYTEILAAKRALRQVEYSDGGYHAFYTNGETGDEEVIL